MPPDLTPDMGTPSMPFAGRYAIERELGRGGMAVVYLARDLSLDRLVAVKVLHRDLASHLGGGRFTREIQITSQLQHRGILPLLDSGEMDGVPYYTMPFVAGDTLAHRLAREHQLPVEVAVRYATELADALAHAHASGVLHRDIKPSNVLLVEDHAVLADFGVARALDASAHDSLTDSGLAVGTAQYMSPEQASADKLDERSDIYALGCLLYEMLAGAPPFSGATTQAILARHMVDTVPNIRVVRSAVNMATQGVIERSLAKVPADRFANVADFRDALVAAQSTPDVARTARPRRLALAVGIVAFAIVAATAIWMMRMPPLDSNRVVGFPLTAPQSIGGSASAGEDVATLIGSSLDRRGTLRWIDGWHLLNETQRRGGLSGPALRRIAVAQRAAYYLTGSIIAQRGDSAQIVLSLYDTKGDTSVSSARALGSALDLRHASTLSVNQLLPFLVPAGASRELAPAWADREPGSVANFLRGEAAFRRAQFSNALQFYREAVRIDSSFAFAAVRGAQAATADHRPAEAATLVQAALGKPMLPQYAAFTRGYAAYLAGHADSAVSEFLAALKIDRDMTSAWAQLGETYVHLVPTRGNADSLAKVAFDSAMARDPQSTSLLFHPIEILLRRGDADAAGPLVSRFIEASPDSVLAAEVMIASDCVRHGPAKVDWQSAVKRSPLGVVSVGAVLGGRGASLACASAAYEAVIQYDTAKVQLSSDNRASALVGLTGVLVAQNRLAEAQKWIETSIARGDGGASLFMFAAPVVPSFESVAAPVATRDSARFGSDYAKCSTTERCWLLGNYEASRGRADRATAIADVLRQRTTPDSLQYVHNLVGGVAAHALLARGDSAGARRALEALLKGPLPTGSALVWFPGGALGAERLTYARLLLAANKPDSALAVAGVFDSPSPTSFPLYLRESLELRARAAERLGDARSASTYRSRLASLTSRQGQ